MSYYDEADYAIASLECEQKAKGIKPQLCDGWRDAKKESPEEEGYYLIYWRGNVEKEY